MGAFLQIRPLSGKFNTEEIVSYIEDNENVMKLDADKATQYIFMDPDPDEDSTPALQHTGRNDDMRMPRINIDENSEITLNLNWNDTANNDLRYFTHWLLSNYECKGSDFQGYEFYNNEELKYWVDMWLPRDPKKYM